MNGFQLGRLLRGSTTLIKKFINEELVNYPISEGQFEYFIMIHQNQGINQKDLGQMVHTGKAAVTKAIKKLLDEDLIYRKIDEKDQRNYGLYISDKGKDYIEVFHSIAGKINTAVLGNFTQEEMDTLYDLMKKMYENAERL